MKSLKLGDATRRWQRRQNEDPEIRKIIQLMRDGEWTTYQYSKDEPSSMKIYVKVRSDLELENGLLYRRLRLKDHDVDTYQFVVPVKYRLVALDLLHNQFDHLGIDRTTALSCERFFWPKMSEEIRTYIQNCEHCLRYKQKSEWAELKPLEALYPLELVHMDYLKLVVKMILTPMFSLLRIILRDIVKLMSQLINRLQQQPKYLSRSSSIIMGGLLKSSPTKVKHSMGNCLKLYVKRLKYSN